MYLAPSSQVPTFTADAIDVLPGPSAKNRPSAAYSEPLEHGTVVKLYDYRWKAHSIATREVRSELEKYLHAPSLPFRISETRAFNANYYQTTLTGIWAAIQADEAKDTEAPDRKVESGFPASGALNLTSIGELDYRIVAFVPELDARTIPHGIFFTVNGQVHGALPDNFITSQLDFAYLATSLFVSVDCTEMGNRAREDFLMASRDRVRRNE